MDPDAKIGLEGRQKVDLDSKIGLIDRQKVDPDSKIGLKGRQKVDLAVLWALARAGHKARRTKVQKKLQKAPRPD